MESQLGTASEAYLREKRETSERAEANSRALADLRAQLQAERAARCAPLPRFPSKPALGIRLLAGCCAHPHLLRSPTPAHTHRDQAEAQLAGARERAALLESDLEAAQRAQREAQDALGSAQRERDEAGAQAADAAAALAEADAARASAEAGAEAARESARRAEAAAQRAHVEAQRCVLGRRPDSPGQPTGEERPASGSWPGASLVACSQSFYCCAPLEQRPAPPSGPLAQARGRVLQEGGSGRGAGGCGGRGGGRC